MNSEFVWKKNLAILAFSQFLAMVGFECCMPFIPLLLKSKLNIMDDHVRGFYVSLYYLVGMVGLTIAYPIWGMLSDRFGRKIMLLRASYMAGLFYPLLAFAPNFWWMLAIRGFTSLFSGTVNPAQTLVITLIPKEKRSMGLGLMGTAQWSGQMAGLVMGGWFWDRFGIVPAFLACGLIYILSGVLVHIFADENFVRPTDTELAEKAAKRKKPSLRSIMTPAIGWIFVIFLMMGIARRITAPFMAMLVEIINGPDKVATITGVTSSFAAVGGVLSGLIIGQLSQRYKPRTLLPPILAASFIFTMGVALAPNIKFLWVSRFLEFVAAGCLQPVLQVMITNITNPEKHGSYLGWTASLSSLGGIICSFISAPVSYWIGVRGVFVASAIIFLLMLPLLFPTIKAYKKELQAADDAA